MFVVADKVIEILEALIVENLRLQEKNKWLQGQCAMLLQRETTANKPAPIPFRPSNPHLLPRAR